jgi:PAS domain S-box-containing protein
MRGSILSIKNEGFASTNCQILGDKLAAVTPVKKSSQQECTETRRRRLPIAKNAPTEAKVALKEQVHLLDMSQDAIFLWRHPGGGIESWNKGAIELYGYERDEAIGRVLHELLRTKFPAPWKEIEKELRERGNWRGELVHYAHSGKEIFVSTRLQLVSQDSESMLVLESTRDITEIKHDAEQLERRAREQSVMARFTLDALQATTIQTVCDNATHILVENMAVDFSAVFECTSDGKSMLLRSGVGWRPGHVGVTRIDRVSQLIQPIIIGDLRRDARLPQFMREHGVSSHMAIVIPGVAGGFGVLGVETRSPRAFSAHDVLFVESIGNALAAAILRVQFEDKLRHTAERLRGIISDRKRLEHEILEISDREQRRIGSDLHDDLCQRLAGIRFSCDALKSSLGNTPIDSSGRVDKIATSVSEAIDRARMLAHGLSPVGLESNGLASALQELTDGVQKLFGIECTFESKGEIALTDTMTGTHLYRIAQEAINNALKHGHSSQLLIALKKVGDKAALTIHDNGVGFSVDGQQSQGMGLRTISYRAGVIGATLQVQSKPGQGTTIVCTFSPNS